MVSRLIGALVAILLLAQGAQATAWRRLLAPEDLAAMLDMEGLRIVDLRAPTGDAPSFAAGHVPGAVSAPYGSWRGPAENPGALISDEALTERLRSAGIAEETPVVIVYQGNTASDFGAAARVYWQLKSVGLARIAILNGGFRVWEEAGMPVSTEAVVPERSAITATMSAQWKATAEQVRAAAEGSGGAVLVDARPEAFFRGAQKHESAPTAGTIPGALNFVFSSWFAPEQGAISMPEAAIARARTLAAEAGDNEIVSFCNTGHWAAINWFALSELAGIENVKLYPESQVGYARRGWRVIPGL